MEIKILTYTIDVIEVPARDMNLSCDNNLYAIGRCSYEFNKIWINQDLPPQIKRRTLLHEITHSVIYNMQMTPIEIDIEKLCDFMGMYADTLVKAADEYFGGKANGTIKKSNQ